MVKNISLKHKFAVVDFIDEEGVVEVVPTTWLLNTNACMWPSHLNVKDFGRAVKKQIACSKKWTKCNVMILYTSDDYQKARTKARELEEHTELDETDEYDDQCEPSKPRRRTRQPAKFDDDYQEEETLTPIKKKQGSSKPSTSRQDFDDCPSPFKDSAHSSKQLPAAAVTPQKERYSSQHLNAGNWIQTSTGNQKFATPPSCSKTMHVTSYPSPYNVQSDINTSGIERSPTPMREQDVESQSVREKYNDWQVQANTSRNELFKKNKDYGSGTKRKHGNEQEEKYPMDMKKFQKKSLRMLVEIKEELRQLKAMQTNTREASCGDGLETCTTLEEIKTVEARLEDEEFMNNTIKYLQRIGGRDGRQHTRNILYKLLTIEVMATCNFHGKRGAKFAFITLQNINKSITNAVLREDARITKDIINAVIADTLRHAPEKMKKKKM